MRIPARRPITDALLGLLAAQTARPVGDGEAPPATAEYPYVVLTGIPGGERSGALFQDPDADAAYVYQTDAVAGRRDQAEWLSDKISDIMLGREPDGTFTVPLAGPPGWTVADRKSVGGVPAPDRDGPADHAVWWASERYVIHLVRSEP